MKERSVNMEMSVVVPLYRCGESIEPLTERLVRVLNGMNLKYEIILVNDSSPGDDWDRVRKVVSANPAIIGLSLSRNFGQHSAITAGLDRACGRWVVVMDGDLQDQPEEIPALYSKALEGYDYVQASRKNRMDSWGKRMSSRCFYAVLGYLTDSKQDADVANFGIYSEKVIGAILQMGDKVRYFPVMVGWVGFSGTRIEVKHSKRELGKTSYSLRRMIRLAIGVIVGFSDKPLRLLIRFGLLTTLIAGMCAVWIFVRAINGGIAVMGYSSMIVSIWGTFGVNMIILGTIGIYLGRTYEQTKNRPVYLVDEEIGDGKPVHKTKDH